MSDSEIAKAFEQWEENMHKRLETRLDQIDECGGMDSLSDSGYWKTMCVAAWADKYMPEKAVGVALMERLCCLWRECKASDTEEDGTPVMPQHDDVRAQLREMWNKAATA